ncbi:MAG TPA: BatA domain-containing protein [Bryobacteraceae bacterium]|nr:BatA domain-containing protein [Bryobacteraceae bacterium]
MGFLAPWFLAGIVAVGLPYYLHLLRQHKSTPQPFSSLMFFERRTQSSVKHRRLRYLMLLALRILLFTLLALAFANPFINRKAAVSTGRTVDVIALDRSFSMRYGDHMAAAKLAAHRALNAVPAAGAAEVLAVDSRVETMSQPGSSRGELSAAIEAIQPTDRISSFGELTRVLRVMHQSTGAQIRVHFVSDMQQTSMPPAFADLDLGPGITLDLICISSKEEPNWALESVTAPAHVYDPKQSRIVATVAGWETPAASKKVALTLDGKTLMSKDVSVPANGRAQVEFLGFDVPYGMHRGEVRLEPHDTLAEDDVFPFATERSDPRRVLFLYESRRAAASFYYKAAMEAAHDTGLIVEPQPAEQAPNQDFSKYAFVVLEDPSASSETLERQLGEYVRRGGALLITLGTASMQRGRVPVIGLHFSEVRETQGAGSVDSGSPAMRGAGQFENARFFDAAHITPAVDTHVLAKLDDGAPLLIEQNLGEGRVLVFASAFDNVTNDFPLHTSFVPFVAQTGRYLAGQEDTASSMTVGSAVELRRARDQGVAADVIGPDGKHELSLGEASRATGYELDRQGFYEVNRADGHRFLVAAHPDRRESDLARVAEETLTLWRNTGINASATANAAGQQETRPWSLWRYVLLAVLAAAVAESVFAVRYLRAGGIS